MASALEHYVNKVRNLSEGNVRDLVDYLNESLELLSRNSNILDNVLETLDIQQHSLGYMFILLAKFTDSPAAVQALADTDTVVKLLRNFTNLCNGEQVRSAPNQFFELYHRFANYLNNGKTHVALGIPILAQAIEKIRLFDSQLTPIHGDLCLLCLTAKIFKPAIAFLDVDVTDIVATDDKSNDAKYFLLYYYYGGMIYTALKNFKQALYFFEVAITTPALAMSHIMLESYKKYILVSIIELGKIQAVPKSASQVISRFMRPLSHAYHELGSAYTTGNSEELRNIVLKNRDQYERDKNFGLVKQVASSLYKKNIQRLTKTFLTLSLADVASRVQLGSPAEAEKYIFKMIKSGEIFATIDQRDGMVIFKDSSENYNSPEMFLKVQSDVAKVMELNKQLLKMEEEIVLNPSFVKKAVGTQEDELSHAKGYSYQSMEQ
uniref:COP9 signalosome complex subunit 3 n=1 Tax=Culicoides sonorensis TaxID=179676 RepID=A0A336KH77_CULSO